MALTPIALIPQVVLGGLMVPMTTNPLLKWPMYAIPARWGFQGVIGQERIAIADSPAWVLDLRKPDANSAADFVSNGRFRCAEAQIASTDFNGAWGFTNYELFWLPWAVLGGMMLGFTAGVVTAVVLDWTVFSKKTVEVRPARWAVTPNVSVTKHGVVAGVGGSF